MQRQRRAARAGRRFFGSTPAPPPREPGPIAVPALGEPEYRKFNDPYLTTMDAGFDPLNFACTPSPFDAATTAVPETAYYNYRESEVKHGRFAMLTTLGLVVSEPNRDLVLDQLNLRPDDAVALEKASLESIPGWFFPLILGVQALAEFSLQKSEDDGNFLSVEYKSDRIPGDLGFDPLGLKKSLTESGYSIVQLHNAEVKHGRAAMIAITAFLFQEFVLKK